MQSNAAAFELLGNCLQVRRDDVTLQPPRSASRKAFRVYAAVRADDLCHTLQPRHVWLATQPILVLWVLPAGPPCGGTGALADHLFMHGTGARGLRLRSIRREQRGALSRRPRSDSSGPALTPPCNWFDGRDPLAKGRAFPHRWK